MPFECIWISDESFNLPTCNVCEVKWRPESFTSSTDSPTANTSVWSLNETTMYLVLHLSSLLFTSKLWKDLCETVQTPVGIPIVNICI